MADGDQEEADDSDDNNSSKNINNRSATKHIGSSKSNTRYRKKSGKALGTKSNKRKDDASNQREQEEEKQDNRSGANLNVSYVQDIEQDQRPEGSSVSDEEEVKGEDHLIIKEEDNDHSLNVSR